jgi:hypothetical protein
MLAMNILFATTGLPHLQTTGGEIASQAFIEAMRCGGHDVNVFGFMRAAAPVPAGSTAIETRAIESRVAGFRRYAWLTQALVRRRPYGCQKFVARHYLSQLRHHAHVRKADVLVLDHARMGWLLPHARRLARSVVLIAHNHEAKLCADQARTQGGMLRRQVFARESRLFSRLEAKLARTADQIWTLSAAEQAAFQDMAKTRDEVVIMDVPGIMYGQVAVPVHPKFDIGLLGTWDWSVNGQGLDWFVRKVVPQLPADLRICVAGRGSERINGRHPNLQGLGYVDDPAAFLAEARVLAIPTTVGAGIQLKTINAISLALPTVSTTIGVRGIDDLPGYVEIADTPEAFAAKLLEQLFAERPLAATGQEWAQKRQSCFTAQIAHQLAKIEAADGPVAGRRDRAARRVA